MEQSEPHEKNNKRPPLKARCLFTTITLTAHPNLFSHQYFQIKNHEKFQKPLFYDLCLLSPVPHITSFVITWSFLRIDQEWNAPPQTVMRTPGIVFVPFRIQHRWKSLYNSWSYVHAGSATKRGRKHTQPLIPFWETSGLQISEGIEYAIGKPRVEKPVACGCGGYRTGMDIASTIEQILSTLLDSKRDKVRRYLLFDHMRFSMTVSL